ncbi:stage V sporulation protein AA [Paenibacillus sediminis]|uniref:Stage V sporulation protein AA n=1 Tax=Paenibacillus sediminis TaxID=664909 RepID=A0ABS4GZS0_9BACL|nr:stage V sporulation protein AA [Paenibacillus sediminis]MBP1935706.1 stage V sporulation protein AA [Paenibacillus sediminis]
MQQSYTPTVYLRLRRHIQLPKGTIITLGHVAHILTDPEWESSLRDLKLYDPKEQDGKLILIDMMQIIRSIKQILPEVKVEYMGEPHVMVEMTVDEKKPSVFMFVLVWILLFFGSALTIMNFHADVNMKEVQIRIVEIISGRRDEHPYLFQVAYSFGIGFGMILFFNHLFKKKWNEEPTPLEVEMFLYQESLNQYAITEEYKRIHNTKPPEDSP